jgi:hypothetical protein
MIHRMIDDLTNLLAEASSRYPGCWDRIDSLRLARANSSHHWPSYCLVPLELSVDIVMGGKSWSNKDLLERSPDIAKLTALSSWSATQRVYKFDAALLHELGETPVSNIPFEIFRQLPDWCVYIQIPDEFVSGCFVHMEATDRTDDELRFLFHLTGAGFDSLYPMVIHSFEGAVKDCLEIEIEEAERALLPVDTGDIELNEFFKRNSNILRNILKVFPKIVSQTLYLCSINGDYARPTTAQKTSSQEILFAPSKSQEIEVGMTIGAKLKAVMSHAAKQKLHEPPQWHHYWTEEKRELILKWGSPLLDNLGRGVPAETGKS